MASPAFCTSTPLLSKTACREVVVSLRRPTPQASAKVANRAPMAKAPSPPTFSRRSFAALLAASPLLLNVRDAHADAVTSQLVPYKDLPKGFTILRPNGWNEFEGLQDSYDIKWQDVIQPLEFITVLTSPVSKDKRLADIGTAQTVGEKLAASRSGELISVAEKDIDGIPAYIFEIKRKQARQLTLLCVNKLKLYSVNASCSERRWSRREKMLRVAIDSFKPRL